MSSRAQVLAALEQAATSGAVPGSESGAGKELGTSPGSTASSAEAAGGAVASAVGGTDGPGDGAYVSGQALAVRLGISRAAVWKHVEGLKGSGYEIESVRARGYRLVGKPAGLDAGAIRARLGVGGRGAVGSRIVVLDVTRSTNTDAMELGRSGEPEGTVVFAEEQTAGRGRLGREWESSRGVNLYLSILLRPAIPTWKTPQLSLVAGVAVAETLREAGLRCGIKWPNDVVVEGGAAHADSAAATPPHQPGAAAPLRKLAGILTEIEAEADRAVFVVVGIGVNVNATRAHFSEDVAATATSMLLETGRASDRNAVAAALLDRFEQCYRAYIAGGFAAVAPRWRALSVMEGRALTVAAPGENVRGTCAGIDDDGALLLDTGGPTPRRILAGDVHLIGGYQPCQP